MVDVKLTTQNGELVGWTRMPKFQRVPEVLVWGQRLFRHIGRSNDDAHEVYSEVDGFMAIIMPVTGTR